MKKFFEKAIKDKGFIPDVGYFRHTLWSISYHIHVKNNENKIIGSWDGHYFVGEENTGNSKDFMIEDFNNFIDKLCAAQK